MNNRYAGVVAFVPFAIALIWAFSERALRFRRRRVLGEVLAREQQRGNRAEAQVERLLAVLQSLQPYTGPAGPSLRNDLLHGLMDAAGALLQAQAVAVLEVDPATDELIVFAARGLAPHYLAQLRIPYGEGVLGQAVRTGVRQTHESISPRVPLGDREKFLNGYPFIAFPLAAGGPVRGILVASRPADGRFDPHASTTAGVIASQAAVILENLALRRDADRSAEDITDALDRALRLNTGEPEQTAPREWTRRLAIELHLPQQMARQVEYSVVLRNVGKLGLMELLGKPDKLTSEEYERVKKHTALAHRLLETVPVLRPAALNILYHQEWFNGEGYPAGLAHEEIPLGARIVSVINAWEAMRSDRPFRKALSREQAVTELRRLAGAQFDPVVVDAFLRILDRWEQEEAKAGAHA